MAEPPIEEFVAYLRRAAVPEKYLPVYEKEARRFIGAFPQLTLHQLGQEEVEDYVRRGKRAGATEQRLRNLRVVGEAVVGFVQHRRPQSRPPPSFRSRRPERSQKRVSFIRDVKVGGIGGCRSSDLSKGGMFLETLATVGIGTVLDLRFRIGPDSDPVSVCGRVVYEHPQLGVGLVFLDVPPEIQQPIDAYVDDQPDSARVG